MATYLVNVTRKAYASVYVEADSAEEALGKSIEKAHAQIGLYDMDFDDFYAEDDGIDVVSRFNVGDKVRWNDPAISDYGTEEEQREALNREFTVVAVCDWCVKITDGHSEVECEDCELEKY